MRNVRLLFVILLSIFLSACGGGGGGGGSAPSNNTNSSTNQNNNNNTPTEKKSITGKVIDGPIKDAIICLDTNNDLSCDGEIYKTSSNELGEYTLEIPKDADENLNIISENGTDTVTNGSFDITMGLKLKYLNQNDSTNNLITPISTFLSSLDENLTDYTKSRLNTYEFKQYMHENPMENKDSFLKNQEILISYKLKNQYNKENNNQTKKLWNSTTDIANTGYTTLSIFTPNSYKETYNSLVNSVKTSLNKDNDVKIVQNYIDKTIKTLDTNKIEDLTAITNSKIFEENKLLNLESPEAKVENHYHYINITWDRVQNATEYLVYIDNKLYDTTTENFISVSTRAHDFNRRSFKVKILSQNPYEISPENRLTINDRGVSDTKPPLINKLNISKNTKSIQACFDYPDVPSSEVQSKWKYLKFHLEIKDNNIGYRRITSRDHSHLTKNEKNQYCFESINLETIRPVFFRVKSELYDRIKESSTYSYSNIDYTYTATNETNISNELTIKALGNTEKINLKWNMLNDIQLFKVLLSENKDLNDSKELVEVYTNEIQFALPYVFLKDKYYLQVHAIKNDNSIIKSNIIEYEGFDNRNYITRLKTKNSDLSYILDIKKPQYLNNDNLFYKIAINSPIEEAYLTSNKATSSGFRLFQFDSNDNYKTIVTGSYSQLAQTNYFVLDYTNKVWALGKPHIFAQGSTNITYPDENNVKDDDRDGIYDINDTCLSTPLGASVNNQGCSSTQLSDSDFDGVLNYKDNCKQTPRNFQVDINGCASFQLNDFDNDKVSNNEDICPISSWNGIEVDYSSATNKGCSTLQEADDDNDLVINFLDKCPDTKITETVNSQGCSVNQLTDSDQDGIFDDKDKCINTPNIYKSQINFEGCYIEEISDDDNDGIKNITDKCDNTPLDLIGQINSEGCANEEINDDDSDGIFNYYDKCSNTPSNSTVFRNGCTLDTIEEIKIYCQRPQAAKSEYEITWDTNSIYDGYELKKFYEYKDMQRNNKNSGSYPYRFSPSIKPYYYKYVNGIKASSKSYGTEVSCDMPIGVSTASSSIFNEGVSFSDSNKNTQDNSTAKTNDTKKDELNPSNEALMFVFKYNGYWWGAGPLQMVNTGYLSSSEVIQLVSGTTCKTPRKNLNNVIATTQKGTEITGTLFYCGEELNKPGELFDILKVYSF